MNTTKTQLNEIGKTSQETKIKFDKTSEDRQE